MHMMDDVACGDYEVYLGMNAGHGSSSLASLASITFPLMQDAAGSLGQSQPPCPHLLLVSIQFMLHLALLVL